MNEIKKLCPTVLGEEVYGKCKDAMDKWSANRAFSMTKTLGADATIVKATMYHAYEFKLESKWTHREFTLEDSGTPVSNPKDIDTYDLWDESLHGLDDDCDLELSETCYKTKCDECNGQGKYTCRSCQGKGKVECSNCNGSGVAECEECGGSGKVDCSACGGKGQVYCPHCTKGGKIGMFETSTLASADCGYCNHTGKVTCTKCGGGRKETCGHCGGSGRDTCSECHGKGEVTCETCDGSGIETCSECEGRGWNPHVWHLSQEQKSDSAGKIWFDEGFAGDAADDYSAYAAESLVDDEQKEGARADQTLAASFDAPFVDEFKTLWKDSDDKLKMAAGARDADKFRYQHAVLKQYDAVIRVEYTYKDKPYVIWVDLCGDNVYEGPEGGLMAEWAKEVAEGGDKAAEIGDTPEAMHKWTMACAITDKDTEISARANRYLNRQAWYFRGAAALTFLIWWSGFGIRQINGAAVLGALTATGVFILGDWMTLRRKWWLSAIGQVMVLAAGAVGFQRMGGEHAGKMAKASADFIMGCSFMFGSLVLLLAHDYALRFRYGKIPHKWIMAALGALVGWATSPAIWLGCSKHVENWSSCAMALGFVFVALAAWRTMARFRVIDCGTWVDKIKNPEKKRAFVNSFAEGYLSWLPKVVFGVLLAWLPISIGLSFLPSSDAKKSESKDVPVVDVSSTVEVKPQAEQSQPAPEPSPTAEVTPTAEQVPSAEAEPVPEVKSEAERTPESEPSDDSEAEERRGIMREKLRHAE